MTVGNRAVTLLLLALLGLAALALVLAAFGALVARLAG